MAKKPQGSVPKARQELGKGKPPRWELTADRKRLRVSLDHGDGRATVLDLPAPEVDKMIRMLGALRAAMAPEVTMTSPIGKLEFVPDPRFYSEPEAMGRGSLFCVRHPGFGWLAFLFPPREAKKLAVWFQKQAEPQAAPKRKN